MAGTRTLEVKILGDAKGASKAFAQIEQHSSKLSTAIKASGVIAAAGIALIAKKAYDAAEQAQIVTNQTAAVLKSTGGVAHVSAKQVDEFAKALARKTGIDDEQIASGENLLLTFTNIRNEVGRGNDIFNQATTAVQDMSVALGQDTKSSAIQLGKALNDPIKGVTALRRVGVSFNAQQIEQIKTLVKSGKTMDAQKLILHEMFKEFGGSAEAAGTPMKKFHERLHEVFETIGKSVLPIVEKLTGWLANALPKALKFVSKSVDAFMGGWENPKAKVAIHGWTGDIIRLGQIAKKIFDGAKKAVDDFMGGWENPKAKNSAKGWTGFFITFGQTTAKFVDFVKHNLTPILAGLAAVVALVVLPPFLAWATATVVATAPIIALGAAVGGIVGGIVYAYEHFQTFRDIVNDVMRVAKTVIRDSIGAIEAFWHEFGDNIMSILKGVFQIVKTIIMDGFKIFRDIFKIGLDLIHGDWGRAWNALKDLVHVALDAIGGILKGAWNVFKGALGIGFKLAKAAWDAQWAAIKAVVRTTVDAAVGFMKDIWGWIEKVINALGKIPGLAKAAANAVTDPGKAITKGVDKGANALKNSAGGRVLTPGGARQLTGLGGLGRAVGGPVSAGQLVQVNEYNRHGKGEFFRPNVGGMVTTNTPVGASGGGDTYNVYVSTGPMVASKEELGRYLEQVLTSWANRKGPLNFRTA